MLFLGLNSAVHEGIIPLGWENEDYLKNLCDLYKKKWALFRCFEPLKCIQLIAQQLIFNEE